MIGLTELMRKSDLVRHLFGEPKERKDLQFGSRSSKRFQSYNPFNSGFKGITT
jgi:hypothetical protein